MGKTGVLVKKIKGKYYGFDYQDIWSKAFVVEVLLHIVCLICISLIQKVYTTRKKLQCTETQPKSTAMQLRSRNFSANNKKVSVIGESCFGNGKGSDVVYVYDNIELSVFRPTGKDASAEIVESVSQRY